MAILELGMKWALEGHARAQKQVEFTSNSIVEHLSPHDVMDRATNKWRITRQNKTRYDSTRELRILLIHQLVLVC